MVKKPILYTLGVISLILGVIGAILPIMPTTPFALLAAYFFSKSSPKIHQWILNLPVVGEDVKQWDDHKVIRPKAKVMSMFALWPMIISTVIFVNTFLWAKISMIVVAILISIFILTRKSQPDTEQA
jgi:uncharacterized membrane protein YbaN (DUF454 family)